MLPSTGISSTLVSNEIGISSHAWGKLCAGARHGGANGIAFNTVEAGGTINDGYLIPGANPYFNIWADNSPGEWVSPNTVDGDLRFRIKRDLSMARYCFRIGDYRNYDHYAIAPSSGNIGIKIEVGSSTQLRIEVRIKLGSYNWRKVANATHVAVEIPGIVMSEPLPISTDWISLFATITINTSTPSKETYPINIFIGTLAGNDFNTIGRIPVDGTYTIEVWKPLPAATIAVKVGTSNTAFLMGTTNDSGISYSSVGTYRKNSGVDTYGKTLNSIEYNSLDSQGNVISTVVISKGQFNSGEKPNMLFSYILAGDDKETFFVSKDRVTSPFRALMVYT